MSRQMDARLERKQFQAEEQLEMTGGRYRWTYRPRLAPMWLFKETNRFVDCWQLEGLQWKPGECHLTWRKGDPFMYIARMPGMVPNMKFRVYEDMGLWSILRMAWIWLWSKKEELPCQ